MMRTLAESGIGFIGGGRMTRILLEGRCRANSWPGRTVVGDPSEAALVRLKGRFPPIRTVANGNLEAAAQDYVFLAVHPPAIPEVAAQIRGALRPDAIVISLAPKVTLASLAGLLGGFSRLARMIPNAGALVNAGFNPVAFSPALGDTDKLGLAELFSTWGCCPQTVEDKLEAYAVLTGMGPTYFAYQLYELRRLGLEFGLTTAEAQLGLERLLVGLARLMADSRLSPEDVLDLVPVRPLADLEPAVLAAYREKLGEAMRRLKP